MLVVGAGAGDVGGGEGDGGLGCEEEEGGEFHGGVRWGGVSGYLEVGEEESLLCEAWMMGLVLVLCEELLGMLFMCGFDVVKWKWDSLAEDRLFISFSSTLHFVRCLLCPSVM